jgi:hypothetical protein
LLVAHGALFALLISACSDESTAGKTATQTPTATVTAAPSDTPTAAATATPRVTDTPLPTATPTSTPTATVRERPAGPAADVSEELTGGNGIFMGEADSFIPPDSYRFVPPDGYIDHEYVAAGTATAYGVPGGTAALTNDGHWNFVPSTTAAYRTRVIVRRPVDAADASGTVIVEWLNVSGGLDANPDYVSLQEEIVRQHHIWVGVSAQIIGIEGGPVIVAAPGGEAFAGKGLKGIDPARYGSLAHPGDGYSFDIFTQVARAVLQGAPLLGGAEPRHVLAVGESQSAIALTTYYDGVQPLTLMFDGFLIHSRGAVSLPLVGPGEYADIAGALAGRVFPVFRDDLEAPVLDIQTETDVAGILNSGVVRQPDTDGFRLWEVAGTAHADAHLVGFVANMLDCGAPINNGPMHLVAKAAFRHLDTWVRTGELPPVAPRLELTSGAMPEVQRDSDGIAIGGIRTPPVDVPVDVLSAVPGPNPQVICLLLGSTQPLPDARLAELYPSRDAYVQEYDAATDQVIESGFILEPDRAALLAFAQPSRIEP